MTDEPNFPFDFGPMPVLTPAPGDSFDLVEGYYLLEQDERRAMFAALHMYTEPVSLWYGFLTSSRRALDGQHPRTKEYAFTTRRELLTLGLASSKAALDALLAGYYSVSFACARHVAECWFLSRYLACHPDKHAAFYAREPGQKKTKLPDIDGIIKDVIACNHALATSETADVLHQVWRNMCKGAHVSAVGLTQAMAHGDGVFHIGATYLPEMTVFGFQNGLTAAYYLMRETLCVLRFADDEAARVANNQREALHQVLDRLVETLNPSGQTHDE